MQSRSRQTSPTFRSTLSLADSARECGTPRRARGAGQSPPRSSLVSGSTNPWGPAGVSPRFGADREQSCNSGLTGAPPPLTKSQSYCPAVGAAGIPQGGRSYFLHGNRAHIPSPQPNKLTGYGILDGEESKSTGRKQFKSYESAKDHYSSQHFASGSLIGQNFEYTSKRDEYNSKRDKNAATSPAAPTREILKEKQNAYQLQSMGVAKAIADAPPSPRKISRRAASPQFHLQSPGVAKSLLGKTESPCRQRPIRKGSPTPKKEPWSLGDGRSQSPRGAFQKQTESSLRLSERSPAPPTPRRSMKCQSPRAQSPSPPWGTDTDAAFSGCRPGASPIRNHIVSSEEAKSMQLRGPAGSQPGTFGSPLTARPPRTSSKVPALRNDPTVPKQFYMPAKPNPAVIHQRQGYYGGA